MPFATKKTSILRRNKTEASSAGNKKAGLVPQCSIISSQPMYNKVRRRGKYTHLKRNNLIKI